MQLLVSHISSYCNQNSTSHMWYCVWCPRCACALASSGSINFAHFTVSIWYLFDHDDHVWSCFDRFPMVSQLSMQEIDSIPFHSIPFHSIPFLHVGDVFLVFPTFRLAKGQSATRSAPLSRRAKALKWHLNFNTTLGDGMQGNTSLHFVTMCAVSHVLSTDNGGWTIHQTGRLSVFPFYSCNIEVFTAFHDSQVWGVAFKESKSEIGIQVWDPSLSCGEPTGNQASAFQNNT